MTTCPLCDKEGLQTLGMVEGRDAIMMQCAACGRFGILNYFRDFLDQYMDQRWKISASVRRRSERNESITIDGATIANLFADAPARGTLDEQLDRVLLMLAKRCRNYWDAYPPTIANDWPLAALKSEKELNYVVALAAELGYIDQVRNIITQGGWRRVAELERVAPKSRQAFVAMWFDSSMDPIWRNGLKAGIEKSGHFNALRISDVEHNDRIDDRIIAEIRRSGLLVADFTGHRGGVYFEAGFAMGLGIPVIWTCREDHLSELHFDTRQYNHILWSDEADLCAKLDNRIQASVLPQTA